MSLHRPAKMLYSIIRIFAASHRRPPFSLRGEDECSTPCGGSRPGSSGRSAHPTRIAIVEYLQYGEMTVGRLCEKVGIEQANASQHLAVLRNKNIVETRKEGNQIYYRLRDPLLAKVLRGDAGVFPAPTSPKRLQILREEQKEAEKHKDGRKSSVKESYTRRLTPKLVESLRGYRRQDLVADLIAGVTVGLVALPLAMAFAISSGVPPQAGLYTAVVAGFLVSALGGSRRRSAGRPGRSSSSWPASSPSFGVDRPADVHADGGRHARRDGSLTGLGTAVRFIPRPVTIGFTNGIAVLIASTQIKDFLGLSDR